MVGVTRILGLRIMIMTFSFEAILVTVSDIKQSGMRSRLRSIEGVRNVCRSNSELGPFFTSTRGGRKVSRNIRVALKISVEICKHIKPVEA
jgi:hypothetical protein